MRDREEGDARRACTWGGHDDMIRGWFRDGDDTHGKH
jgi:hypothetical protein